MISLKNFGLRIHNNFRIRLSVCLSTAAKKPNTAQLYLILIAGIIEAHNQRSVGAIIRALLNFLLFDFRK